VLFLRLRMDNATDDELDTVKGIIDTRLEGKQIYDKTVTVDRVNKRVLVEIPYKKAVNMAIL